MAADRYHRPFNGSVSETSAPAAYWLKAAHVVQNNVEVAYARSDRFKGRQFMKDWETRLAGTPRPHSPFAEPAE